MLYEKNEAVPVKHDQITRVTDTKGKVQIILPDPAPKYLSFSLQINWARWRCSSSDVVLTQDLIQQGIVGRIPPKRSKDDVPIKATPGEIVFPARPLSFFERLFYPVMKE
jgi:hypothetical protein